MSTFACSLFTKYHRRALFEMNGFVTRISSSKDAVERGLFVLYRGMINVSLSDENYTSSSQS